MLLPVIRTGCDLGIFKEIVDHGKPVSSEELANPSAASPLLLSLQNMLNLATTILTVTPGRLLRYLAAFDVIRETAPDTNTASDTTRVLAQPEWRSATDFW